MKSTPPTGRPQPPYSEGSDPAPVSALDELGSQLAFVLTKLADGCAALTQAQRHVGESGQALSHVVDDDADTDVLACVGSYREVWYTTSEARTTLVTLDEAIRAYMTTIGAPGAEAAGIPSDDNASPPPATGQRPPGPEPMPEPALPVGSPEWVEHEGKKIDPSKVHVTTGVLYDEQGRELARCESAQDTARVRVQRELEEASRFPKPLGWKPGDEFWSSSHAEPKLALWMRDQQIKHATILINKDRVCRGEQGCRRALAAILPRDSSVTVISSVTGVRLPLKGAADVRNDDR